jgi:hypothetical protein
MKSTLKIIGVITLAFGLSTSCSNDDVTLPPIGGYNSSDEVAATNNIAKWSFESALTESKQNLTGTGTNVAYATGAKGQAWQGSSTQPRYAIYPAGTAIPALSSYTFSFWMNSDSMKINTTNPGVPVQGKGAQGIFAYANPTGFWGGINLFVENRGSSDGDTLRLKLLVENKRSGVVWATQSPIIRIPGTLNKWVHIALTYDDQSSIFSAYVNGVAASKMEVPYQDKAPTGSPTGFVGNTYTQYANDPGDWNNKNSAPKFGVLQTAPGTQMVIGSHQFTTTPALNAGGTQQPWATTFAGQLDEFRIYNKALTTGDVNALYELEKAGR